MQHNDDEDDDCKEGETKEEVEDYDEEGKNNTTCVIPLADNFN